MLLNDHHINHNKAIKAMRTMAANFKILAEVGTVVVVVVYVVGSAFSSPSHVFLAGFHFSFVAHPQFGAYFVPKQAVQDLIH